MTVDIDEALLRFSHRNNKEICEYSCRLYPQGQFGVIEPCNCHECRNPKQEFEGIFLIKKSEVEDYLKRFNPMQLRYNNLQEVNPNFKAYNFGESKGKTFERVLIYPTNKMVEWIFNNNTVLPFSTRAKLYVAITRAKYSVAFVLDHNNSTLPDGIKAVYSTK
jgi:DNA helicase-2/ATP-dependent DNA helicase PcrA